MSADFKPDAASVLRAMASNYTDGHCWDDLDAKACIMAADEIDHLRATPAPGAPAEGAQRWLAVVREHAQSARANAQKLREYPGMEQEARARELAAQYLIETAGCMAMDERHAAVLLAVADSAGKISALRAMLDAAPGAPGQEAAAVQALTRLTEWAQAVHPDVTYSGDHPIAVARRTLTAANK